MLEKKGRMKDKITLVPGMTTLPTPAVSHESRHAWTRLKMFGRVGLGAGMVWAQSAAAFSIVPISQGQLASGNIALIVQITLNPGETVPWHYHTGPALVTVISGTLTEDVGCGTPMAAYSAGNALTETAGHVHRLFNLGHDPVVFTGVAIFPDCDPNNGTVFVNGPSCEGKSGQSHREEIPVCDD